PRHRQAHPELLRDAADRNGVAVPRSSPPRGTGVGPARVAVVGQGETREVLPVDAGGETASDRRELPLGTVRPRHEPGPAALGVETMPDMRSLLYRLKSLWHRQAREADLDAELQFHLEAEAEEHIAAGLTAESARQAARRSLGNIALAREDARE